MRILKFYADWCGPCKQQNKILENSPIEVQPIDVEKEKYEELVEKFHVRNLPTMVIVDDEDNEIKRFVGLTPLNKIEEFIKEYK